jgi:tetratricopeptide (TPR) repeat protein
MSPTAQQPTRGTRARRAARAASDAGERRIRQRSEPRLAVARFDPDELAALEEERDFLLRSLDDLEREYAAGDLDQEDYLALRDDYTARAAAAIRAVEQRQAVVDAAPPARSPLRRVTIVAAVLLFALGAGWAVKASAGERAPGGQLTGDIRQSSIDELARANQHIAEAQAAFQAGDTTRAVESYKDAIDAYDRALELQPSNVEAMTYRGWLLHNLALQAEGTQAAAELDASARSWLDRAIETDATYPDARIFRAILLERQGRPADALADLAVVDPGRLPPQMAQMLESLRSRLSSTAQPGG